MTDFDTFFIETEDGGFYAIFDLTLPVSWESGGSSEEVLDSLGDLIAYTEEMRRAILAIERAGGRVVVSEAFEDALDVYFDSREEAEAALRALHKRDVLDFLVSHPGDALEMEDEEEPEGSGNGQAYLN